MEVAWMIRLAKKLYQDYEETSMPYEDFLEWFVKKRLGWWGRIVLAHLLFLSYYAIAANPLHFVFVFYGLLLLLVYTVLSEFFSLRKKIKRIFHRK